MTITRVIMLSSRGGAAGNGAPAVGILGSGFTGASYVGFGGVLATKLVVAADGFITCLAPPVTGAASTVDVVVSPNADLSGGVTLAGGFTYTAWTAVGALVPVPGVLLLDSVTGQPVLATIASGAWAFTVLAVTGLTITSITPTRWPINPPASFPGWGPPWA